jgi:hypothetical protein
VALAALVAVVATGCATSETPPPGAAPPDLRQTVEELRRSVNDLQAELASTRRVAVTQPQLLGLRQELQAVQRAIEALVRDVDQRHLEAVQALERRVAALGRRVDELGSASRPPEPAPAPPVTPPAATAEPVPPPAAGQLVTIRRVRPSVAGGETRIGVEADGPLAPRVAVLADPPRLVLDFENAAFGFDRAPLSVDGGVVERIRFIQLRAAPTPVIRVLLSLREPAPHWLETPPRGLVIHVGSEPGRR